MNRPLKSRVLAGTLSAIALGMVCIPPFTGCRPHAGPGTAIAASVGPPGTEPAQTAAPDTASARSPQRAKTERFLDGRLPIGCYLYLYNWRQSKDPGAHDLDDAIDDLASRGFTYLYIGGVTDNPLWKRVLDRCEAKRIAIVAQLESAYLRSPDADVERLARAAVPLIRTYKDHPALMAFSVREEPAANLMPALRRYYQAILNEVPDAPLNLVHSNLPALVGMEPPYPETIGTDRYAFWWEMSGHRATPQYALAWYQTSLDLFYQQAVRRGADFQAVFTANTIEFLTTPERVKSSFYGPGANGDGAGEARERFLGHVLGLADSGRQGWQRGPDEFLRYWKYYRPPANCVSAMCWLSIMEGARSVVTWAYAPLRPEMRDAAHRREGRVGVEYICSILGWEGTGTRQLEEFADFARQVQRYARLVRVMEKECAARDWKQLPLGHELAPAADCSAPALQIGEPEAVWRSFTVPGCSGRVVVVVNTRVGSWGADGGSPRMLGAGDAFRIDERGEAVDFTPALGLRSIPIRLLRPDTVCTDLGTGQVLAVDAQGMVALTVPPGGVRFLHLGTQAEGARLMGAYLQPAARP